VPNTLLARGTPAEVRDCCKKLIDEVGADGGYIMDACAIVQNDAQVENIRAMTEFTRDYGVYSQAPHAPDPVLPTVRPRDEGRLAALKKDLVGDGPPPGICIPWETRKPELGPISGDEGIVKRIWENLEGFAYTYIWHCLVSF
jgi:hypothetical protein